MTYDAAFCKVREVSNAALEHLLRILITSVEGDEQKLRESLQHD